MIIALAILGADPTFVWATSSAALLLWYQERLS